MPRLVVFQHASFISSVLKVLNVLKYNTSIFRQKEVEVEYILDISKHGYFTLSNREDLAHINSDSDSELTSKALKNTMNSQNTDSDNEIDTCQKHKSTQKAIRLCMFSHRASGFLVFCSGFAADCQTQKLFRNGQILRKALQTVLNSRRWQLLGH